MDLYDDCDNFDPYEVYEDDREEFESRLLWEESLADAADEAWECNCEACAELDGLYELEDDHD